MKQVKTIEYGDLSRADLVVDAVYRGGKKNTAGDDPISRLLSTGNQGGFRHRGNIERTDLNLIAIVSSLSEAEWPDYLDVETGRFVYYGDNRSPGCRLHETKKKLNIVLRDIFGLLHSGGRDRIPPIFVFTKSGERRDVVFRGLAAPGAEELNAVEDLVAVWKSAPEGRFQNYRAVFTILNVPVVSRAWIEELKRNRNAQTDRPEVWSKWISAGIYDSLEARKTRKYRTKSEQLPLNNEDGHLLKEIYDYFKDNPFAFERCAAELAQIMDRNIVEYELTRKTSDGGRDAVGKYRIGTKDNSIQVDFALEAKCYFPGNASGVEDSSRLISRLRYRQFGIFVTTSYLGEQAYREIVADGHPLVVVSGGDIVALLKNAGYSTVESIQDWLKKFPR